MTPSYISLSRHNQDQVMQSVRDQKNKSSFLSRLQVKIHHIAKTIFHFLAHCYAICLSKLNGERCKQTNAHPLDLEEIQTVEEEDRQTIDWKQLGLKEQQLETIRTCNSLIKQNQLLQAIPLFDSMFGYLELETKTSPEVIEKLRNVSVRMNQAFLNKEAIDADEILFLSED